MARVMSLTCKTLIKPMVFFLFERYFIFLIHTHKLLITANIQQEYMLYDNNKLEVLSKLN